MHQQFPSYATRNLNGLSCRNLKITDSFKFLDLPTVLWLLTNASALLNQKVAKTPCLLRWFVVHSRAVGQSKNLEGPVTTESHLMKIYQGKQLIQIPFRFSNLVLNLDFETAKIFKKHRKCRIFQHFSNLVELQSIDHPNSNLSCSFTSF